MPKAFTCAVEPQVYNQKITFQWYTMAECMNINSDVCNEIRKKGINWLDLIPEEIGNKILITAFTGAKKLNQAIQFEHHAYVCYKKREDNKWRRRCPTETAERLINKEWIHSLLEVRIYTVYED